MIAALRRLADDGAPRSRDVLWMPLSTVSAILTRIGLGKRSRLEPLEPPNRYERRRPGELAPHRRQEARPDRPARPPRARRPQDEKHAGSAGSIVHVASTTRPGSPTSRCSTDEKCRRPAVGFLRRAVAHFAALGIRVERVMTDNGSGYRSLVHALACQALGSSTCAPGPTGRAPTAKPNASSAHCSAAGPTAPSTRSSTNADRGPHRLARLLQSPRPHGSLGHQTPMSRLHKLMNNVPGSYI